MGSMSGGFPPAIARLIFSGLEPAGLQFPVNINFNAAGARQPEQRTESFSLPVPRVNARFEDNFMLSDDDHNSSEEEGYSSFVKRESLANADPVSAGCGTSPLGTKQIGRAHV